MLNQKLQLKLSQKLSPQQIQLMKLIQLTTAELEQKIKNAGKTFHFVLSRGMDPGSVIGLLILRNEGDPFNQNSISIFLDHIRATIVVFSEVV